MHSAAYCQAQGILYRLVGCMCRAEEIKYRPQKLQAFLLKLRGCAADEGHQTLLARNATEFAACLRLREQVQFLRIVVHSDNKTCIVSHRVDTI